MFFKAKVTIYKDPSKIFWAIKLNYPVHKTIAFTRFHAC